ncbi:hypothetical protein AMATHDRAFT_73885 [Amanita thiersii Skay4041]|uniref:PUB domain-containing protein n=1 Tax=Amanita thiersii Skay4041 TaxID=703135 RepID=A0A2A9NP48_9AGAR|nr:hypothetical protein AMATHDRAFT_73885 [Amanita thiersii Skay4041]
MEHRADHNPVAEAATRRLQEMATQVSPVQLLAERERRQAFRRMIDPGIMRPNSKEQAMSSLKTLLTIAENLIREPNNAKFKQFKPTNTIIKRELVDPKGTLEYAVELGFRPEVHDFRPYYVHNSRYISDLRIGTFILREFIELETEKSERAIRSKKEEKAVAAEAALKVKMAFMDDRLSKSLRDEREKQRQAFISGRGTSLDHHSSTSTSARSSSPEAFTQNAGHTLDGNPLPYNNNNP